MTAAPPQHAPEGTADRPRPVLSPVESGATVVAASGAVLVLEIVAIRLVAPYVGNTLETYSAAIGVALAGIALGAAIGGKVADLVDPRRWVGLLLAVGGALLVATRPVVVLLGPLVGVGPAAVVILMFAAVVLPATVLSAVPPAVVKLQLTGLSDAGSVVGRLSALGTAGALVATFLTGFVLLGTFSTTTILLVLGVSLVLGGLALHVRLRSLAAAAAPALVVGGLTVLVTGGLVGLPGPCEEETAYYCVSVEAEGSERLLYLDNLRHSSVDLDDPTALEFRYTRRFADAVEALLPPGPVDAVHIGGGGFTFPRWLAATRPGSVSTVLELDPGVVEVGREELGLVTGPDLRVELGDARISLQQLPDDSADLLVGDAFGAVSVPWHLATQQFYEDVQRVLRDDGVFLLNVIDFPPNDLAAAQVATLRSVFADVALVVTPAERDDTGGGNFVVLASDRPLDTAAVQQRSVREGDTVLTGEDLSAWIGDAPVLTDDWAPVDQLLTPYVGPRGA